MALFSRRKAVAVIAVAGLLSSACIVTTVVLIRRGRDAEVERESNGRFQREQLRFDELNFRFAPPPDQWTQVEARQINPDSVVAYVSRNPEMAFIALAEAPGVERQGDLETIEDLVLANHRSLWKTVTLRDSRPETRADIAGKRLVVEVADEQKKLTYVSWLGIHQGHVYQLQVFSNQADTASLNRAADDMFARFSLLDPESDRTQRQSDRRLPLAPAWLHAAAGGHRLAALGQPAGSAARRRISAR